MAEARMTKLSDFDLDYSYGLQGENLVDQLLNGAKTVEVKRDRRWWDTGNIYIEVSCWYNTSQSWEDSGLSVTEAKYWAFVLESGVILVPTNHVKYAVKVFGRAITCDIEPNRSRGYLIKAEDLLTAMKELD
jgi:hypothetical protein